MSLGEQERISIVNPEGKVTLKILRRLRLSPDNGSFYVFYKNKKYQVHISYINEKQQEIKELCIFTDGFLSFLRSD
jgi:hypothetical protein